MAICTCKKCGYSVGDENIDGSEDLEMKIHIIESHANYLGAIDAVLKVLQERLKSSMDAQAFVNQQMSIHSANIKPGEVIDVPMPLEKLQLAQNRALYEYGIVLLEGIVKAVKEEDWKKVVT